MSGIFAKFSDHAFHADARGSIDVCDDAGWSRMRARVTEIWHGAVDEWRGNGARLGRARRIGARGVSAQDHAVESAIVEHEGCVVALDGFLFGGADGRDDAVAIVSSYLNGQATFLDRLEGELAFVLWDSRKRVLLAGCDATGGRTLAYIARSGEIAIATRGLALRAWEGGKAQIDEDYVAHVACDAWSLGPGATAFHGMRRLRPGHVLVASARGVEERRGADVRLGRVSARSPLEWNHGLVDAIDAAVDTRSRGVRTGVALSGGLDSASVAASLSRNGAPRDAFAIVSPQRPDLDESEPLRALAAHLPPLRVHPIACDGDDAFDPDPSRPPFDDPILVGGGFLAPRLRALVSARAAGIECLLDGEGGDEIFDLSTVLSDLLAPAHWRLLGEASPSWPRLRSAIWRGAILPSFPSTLRVALHDRDVRRRRAAPTWLRPDFANSALARATLREPREQGAHGGYKERVLFLLNRAWTAGSRVAMRILAASRGIRASSPLIDARVIGVAIAAPPALRFVEGRSKAFLREALRDRLPSSIVAREKDDRLYSDYVRRSLLAKRTTGRLLDRLAGVAPLVDAVDPHEVERVLARLRGGAPGDTTVLWRLSALVRFVDWHAQIDREHAPI